MKRLRSSFWLNSIFYTFLQRFSLFFFGAVSYMLLVRALMPANNAVWALYLMILMLFETVKQGLLRNPTIKFLALSEHADKKSEVQYAALMINIIFSAVAILLLVLFSGLIGTLLKSPELVPLLWWSSALIILLIPFNHCEVMMQAHYKFSSIFWAHFIRQGFFFAGIVILFLLPRQYFTLINLMMLQIGALLLGSLVMYINARPYLVTSTHFDKKILGNMLHFGKFIFGTNLAANLARSFDHFVTANVLSPAEGKSFVANYNVVSRINTMMDVPSLAVADVLFPKSVQTLETDGLGKVKYYFEKMIATLLALVLPASLFIFIFPKFVVYVLAGSSYYGAVPILQMTIMFSIQRPLGYLFGSTLDSIGKPKVNFIVALCLMTFSLVINYLFLYQFGGTGAAYATIVNAVVGLIVMIFILQKYIHLEVRNIYLYGIGVYRDAFKMLKKFSGAKAAQP